MAVIGKIRERSSLLLIVIGGALMAFVLTDFFSSRTSVFGSELDFIGTIDGKDIRGIEFNERYERELENYKTRENSTDVPDFVQSQLRDQLWQQYMTEYILDAQIEEIGLTVSTEELADMAYGDRPHAQVKQAFTNPQTGQFNKNDVINFLKTMEQDETGKTKQQWLVFEKAMKKERLSNKYNTMIGKGLYATTFEAELDFINKGKLSTITYVTKRYADMPDSSVSVSESDIKAYYKANQDKFKEKKSRKIEYALFEVLPSSEDTAAIQKWVDETYAGFALTQDDSNFVNANSDKEFDFRFYSKNEPNLNFDTNLFNVDSIGYMVSPFIEESNYKMMKLSKMKFAPDSVKARHILLTADKKDMEAVKTRVDSIKNAILGGASFEDMAKKYSIDPGSKDNGGDLGYFKEGFMIAVINDSCFNGALNKLMVVESPFGVHLLEVMEKSPVVKKIQVAIIQRSIDASRETMDIQFTAANDISVDLEAVDGFGDLKETYGAKISEAEVGENDFLVADIESSRGLIRWAYNAELNAVSEALQFGGNFVVAKLTEIHEDGVAPLERVRAEVEMGAIKEKKAEILIQEMSGFTSLSEASAALGVEELRADNVMFESFSIPGMGREPYVLGKIFSMNIDDLSVPLKGENGVYIVHVDVVKEAGELPNGGVLNKNQIESNRSSRAQFEAFEALKDRVEIEDNRSKFY